jgi:predicted Zn-dependent peptidase
VTTPKVHTLANGARIICDPMAGFETLALSVVVGRGARWETKAQMGWAHLMEHMVFKGAGQRSSKDIVEVIEAEGGNINAATGHERTSYQCRMLTGGLPLAMAVCSDLVFRPTLDPAELEREKSVIAQEIAEAADTPDDLVFDLAQEAAFGDSALGRPILGTVKSVGKAKVATLAEFRARLYAPDRIVISASGAVDEDELLAQAERWFGDQTSPADAFQPEPVSFRGEVRTRSQKLEQAHLVFMLPGVSAAHDDYFAQRIFVEALGGGMSSRLFQEAREARGLAYNIDAFAETYADTGVIGVYAGAAGKDAVETAKVSAEQIRALTDAPNENELARAKAQMKGGLFMGRESALARAEQAAGQVLLFDRTLSSAELAEGIDAVTLADLKRVGERALSLEKSAGAVLGPKIAAGAAEAFQASLFP